MYTAYFPSPLGLIKLQCSDEHVQQLVFVNEEIKIPNQDHPLLQLGLRQLEAYFFGELKIFDLPLDQKGTQFQQSVWNLLQKIPFGKTISYQQLALQYGDVKAIRAVAAANGRNNLAIVIPCHRVIGSNQTLTGYAGGLWRKKWLLEHEGKYNGSAQQLGLEM